MSGQQQARRTKRPRPPLNPSTLRALALHYLGRYATTKARLQHYLERKLRERGWVETAPMPDLEALIVEFADLGYVDDAGFAETRVRSMLRRGYGRGRVVAALRHAGIDPELTNLASRVNSDSEREAALAFARRRRLGPFGVPIVDHKTRERAIAAFIRAGHSYEIAREILETDADSQNSADFLR